MSGSCGWWRGGLLAVLIAGQVGCAARGRVAEAPDPGSPEARFLTGALAATIADRFGPVPVADGGQP